MRILAGVPLGERQTTVGFSTTAIFGYLVGYLFGNCGYEASIIIS